MGEHSKAGTSFAEKLGYATGWVFVNRRRLAAGAIVALPFVARFVPDFPSSEILAALRAILGA